MLTQHVFSSTHALDMLKFKVEEEEKEEEDPSTTSSDVPK